jgi:hypothetical protein
MKAGFLAVAAAIASGVSANGHKHGRHIHEAFHAERGVYATGVYSTGVYSTGVPEATCGCTTIVSTIYGEATRTKHLLSNKTYKKKLNNV